jgi:hypothetical protein
MCDGGRDDGPEGVEPPRRRRSVRELLGRAHPIMMPCRFPPVGLTTPSPTATPPSTRPVSCQRAIEQRTPPDDDPRLRKRNCHERWPRRLSCGYNSATPQAKNAAKVQVSAAFQRPLAPKQVRYHCATPRWLQRTGRRLRGPGPSGSPAAIRAMRNRTGAAKTVRARPDEPQSAGTICSKVDAPYARRGESSPLRFKTPMSAA